MNILNAVVSDLLRSLAALAWIANLLLLSAPLQARLTKSAPVDEPVIAQVIEAKLPE